MEKTCFFIIFGHCAKHSRPSGNFLIAGISERLFAGTVEYFEEKSAFENLFFIIFVHLIQLFISVENFGGGVLEIAFFVLKTRETFFIKRLFLPSFLDIGRESLSLLANSPQEGCQNLILRVQRSILGKYIILTTCLSGFRNIESNFAALSKILAVGFYKLSALC